MSDRLTPPNEKYIPQIKGTLRDHIVEVPVCIRRASGISVFGRRIKSLVFSTDVAVIRNCNADAVIAVYPFTPQPVITHALMMAAETPVFCGVGGGITTGRRVVNLAMDAEFEGAAGIVVNAPTIDETIVLLRETIDIPIVVTVVSEHTDIDARLRAGATIFNVSGASKTASIVRAIRRDHPEVPIIATGGPTDDTIMETIDAGANAITYTPPSNGELFRVLMDRYRMKAEAEAER